MATETELVTLYHGTDAEGFLGITNAGRIEAVRMGVYLTPRRSMAAEYGTHVVQVRVDKSLLRRDFSAHEFEVEVEIDEWLRLGGSVYVAGDVAVG